ncbi:BRCT domain-containing protein [Roseiconus nitratireducens]|nr:BRCT domain-containing protein [Roseiconus nitratireducens]
MMRNEDNAHYLRYTGPQRVDKAMHTLEGIVRGISIDNLVNTQELTALTRWVSEHEEFANRHPFNEVIDRLHQILADGAVDEEERADILWLCEKFSTENSFFCELSSDMQRLQGIVAGIAADGIITEDELRGLREWLDDNDQLRTCWPYDEIDSHVTRVMRDGRIDPEEHAFLLEYFNEFSSLTGGKAFSKPQPGRSHLVSGVCHSCPDIQFDDKSFCFTGTSDRTNRDQLAVQVHELGGWFSPRVTQSLHYLVIGAKGNPCWAFSCYGRKVEQAVSLRMKGFPVAIVHENDYWDAVEDLC